VLIFSTNGVVTADVGPYLRFAMNPLGVKILATRYSGVVVVMLVG
jgi:hypothetical protein